MQCDVGAIAVKKSSDFYGNYEKVITFCYAIVLVSWACDICLLNNISSVESSAPIYGLCKDLLFVFSESWSAGEV